MTWRDYFNDIDLNIKIKPGIKMTQRAATQDRRDLQRLNRSSEHSWVLTVNGDALITKNIANIGPSGLSFKTPTSSSFALGQNLRLTISLKKDESFDCEGKVVWAKDSKETVGSMQLLGIRFSNLPSRVDMAIMREINDSLLSSRRQAIAQGQADPQTRNKSQKRRTTWHSVVFMTCGIFVFLAMTAALITAAYLHQQAHPEYSIEFKFNQAMMKKMFNLNDPK